MKVKKSHLQFVYDFSNYINEISNEINKIQIGKISIKKEINAIISACMYMI